MLASNQTLRPNSRSLAAKSLDRLALIALVGDENVRQAAPVRLTVRGDAATRYGVGRSGATLAAPGGTLAS